MSENWKKLFTADDVADAVEEWINEPEQAESFLDEDLVEFIRSLGERTDG